MARGTEPGWAAEAVSRTPNPPCCRASDSASLLLLWKYTTTVLWPCIDEHGVDLGRPPSRAEVLSGDPLLIDPYAQLHLQLSAPTLAQLRSECPALPAYLTPASG